MSLGVPGITLDMVVTDSLVACWAIVTSHLGDLSQPTQPTYRDN